MFSSPESKIIGSQQEMQSLNYPAPIISGLPADLSLTSVIHGLKLFPGRRKAR